MSKIDVSKKILGENEQSAFRNSHFFAENKNFCINMISSAGSGILNNKYRKKLKACKKRFNKLGLIKIIKPESIKIDWNDQCFYPEYIELYQSEQAILQQMLSLGHKI